MELSRRRVNTKDKRCKVSWDYEDYGLVYRVGRRGSKKYSRIYQTNSTHKPEELKFEVELKPSKLLQKLLIDNSIQQFEYNLIKEHYIHSFRSVTLNSLYADWLLYWYRKWAQKSNINGSITTYFKLPQIDNKELIFNYFRTLSYIQNHGKKQQIFQINDEQQSFYEVTFRLIDSIRYVKVNEKNHQPRKKVLNIFKQFQDLHHFKLETFQTILNDNLSLNHNYSGFTSVVMIPYFNVKKQANIWNVTLLIAHQFYEYNFPFQFNESFLYWEKTYHFEVKT